MVTDDDPVRASLSALAGFLVGQETVVETLQRIIELSAVAVPPAAYTGLTMLVEDQVTTSVFSDPEVREIDQAQYEAGSGPCLDSFRHGVVYGIPSTKDDTTWAEFSQKALQHGIRSTLSMPLLGADRPLGALNFYSPEEDGFSEEDQRAGAAFATQAAVVVANSQAYWDERGLREQLAEAMQSRATIEQAKGIVMAQSGVDADEAFDILRRASQRENRKLRDIARELVDRTSRSSPS